MKREESNDSISKSEIETQTFYMKKMKEINDRKYLKKGRRPGMSIQTFGCQMNVRDSEKLTGMLSEMGYITATDDSDMDLIIYNTCCVRENAENRLYGNLGALKKRKNENRDLRIIVCGCMMQQDGAIEKIKKSYRNVDVIFGTFNLHRLPQLLFTNHETEHQVIDIWKEHGEIIEDLPSIRQSRHRASVNIMYGCNNFCSYCIVPYVRGRERSRPMDEILQEINSLCADGVIEILLLGQNVNSYGTGLTGEVTFAQLLRRVNQIPELRRIRFMTSHPKDLSDELIAAMAECSRVCRQLHLPFQAGSNAILHRMNRKYTKEDYLMLIEKVRKAIPDIAVSTDIIVGFPGETDEDFSHTLDICERVGFSAAYTFIYSVRNGTPAAGMPEQIPEEMSKERFNRLLELINPIFLEINRRKIGNCLEVLVEGEHDGLSTGRTEDNSLVHFKGGGCIGSIVNVKIVDCKSFYLIGEME